MILTKKPPNIPDFGEKGWCGSTWKKMFNNQELPSMNQIQEGIKAGAKTYFENETQGITDENKVKEGWENIKDTWDFLFSQAKIEDRESPLDRGMEQDEYGAYVMGSQG